MNLKSKNTKKLKKNTKMIKWSMMISISVGELPLREHLLKSKRNFKKSISSSAMVEMQN